jgi:hypothetical protein
VGWPLYSLAEWDYIGRDLLVVFELIASSSKEGVYVQSLSCAEEGGRSWCVAMERERPLFKDLYELKEDLGKYVHNIIIVVELDFSLSFTMQISSHK